ncbi:MAG: outer membrane protein assembly factor BamD [Candidatus Acidiferrum sp.]
MRRFALLLMCALTLTCASQCSAQIFHKKKPVNKSTDATNTAEPDKQLYDKAMVDIKRGRHEVGRLALQTLINTYPDSEYLAKAKLAIADSYFKEGGTSNITLAINGYKDFIVFFPFLPEAAYAQMQVAMANYNMMPKPDRDTTHIRAAEEEFQTFLLKYPKDPLVPQAEQRLREVQEVLAEGQYRVAYYYYMKGDRRATAGRLIPLVRRYPLYSKSDTALWMLGEIFEKSERKDVAGSYYAQIVKNYPLSSRAANAKGKLKDFGMPVPQADPKAVAWMTAEQNAPRQHESLVRKPLGILHSGPDVKMTARNGVPNLEPESNESTNDILAGGGRTTIAGTGGGTTGIVATVKPGEPAPAGATTEDVNSTAGSDPAPGSAPSADSQPESAGTAAPGDGSSTSTATQDGSTSADSSKTDNTQPASGSSSQNHKESSSKKKGLKKILPW